MLDALKKVLEAQNYFYDVCGFKVTNFIVENEGVEYYAHFYCLENKNIRFRIAKKTPTKTGWFVVMWKRKDNVIVPYDYVDQVDFFVINVVNQSKIGQFVFPQSVLLERGVFSIDSKGGKRAMRVYSPWDGTQSVQATRTKKWQEQYFVDMSFKNAETIERIKKLYFIF